MVPKNVKIGAVCMRHQQDHAMMKIYKVKVRYFNKSFLHRKLPNDETVARDWLLYSPSTGKNFCFYCTLFGLPNNGSQFSGKGFDDWKHPDVVHQHE